MKLNVLKKIVREELNNTLIEMSQSEKKKGISTIIASIYTKLMKGDIEAAKQTLASDPYLQNIVQEISNLENEIVDELMKNPIVFLDAMKRVQNKKG